MNRRRIALALAFLAGSAVAATIVVAALGSSSAGDRLAALSAALRSQRLDHVVVANSRRVVTNGGEAKNAAVLMVTDGAVAARAASCPGGVSDLSLVARHNSAYVSVRSSRIDETVGGGHGLRCSPSRLARDLAIASGVSKARAARLTR